MVNKADGSVMLQVLEQQPPNQLQEVSELVTETLPGNKRVKPTPTIKKMKKEAADSLMDVISISSTESDVNIDVSIVLIFQFKL